MKCQGCQFENPDVANFCGECGTELERVCLKCNYLNPPQFKFCNKCGSSLIIPAKEGPRELSFEEKLAKIQQYLPKDLTQKILAQRDKIEGERKQVTVMFCDMEGFTSLTEKLGSEQMYSMMDEVYEILIYKVHDYEGTVNELTGDGIMALFGAPIALEDAPQRAIRSALAIHREITGFSDRMEQEKGIPPLKMRIGIHTGQVIVGTLGNDLRVEFKAVGDTVNLASRMEGLADPGTTFVTEETFQLTEGLFRFESLGEKLVKGKEEPVKVYQVIAPSTRRTRFDVSAERGLTPFVGRERELELLLDGFERAKAGKGQAFSIISEAGCGKSRLLYEFRKAVANEDVNFLEGKCLSYSRGVAYHPHIDILKSSFDVQEGEGDSEIREKVKRGLKILEVDEPSTLPYLLELLSVKDSGIDQISMSPEAKKDRIIEAIKRIVIKGSEMKPLIIAIEDLHWMDKSSEDVAKDLLENIPGSRVLLIFTYRPEFVHTWGAKSYHNQLTLHRLSNRESLEMATHILGTKEIEKALEELILEKTEGVPFFIEEFIKSLKDLRIIERKDNTYRLIKDIQQLTIPSTIQDVIMARVDSLPERAKEVLQTGSVIEREFSYPLINRIMGLPEKELLSHLSVLKDSELLYERGIYPQSNYIFKHALTREVVYDSILFKRKTKLHEEIGNAIEELNKDSLSEHYGVVAEHFIASENYEKGAEYSKLAARKSQKAASFKDAILHGEKRLACLERLPRTEDVEKNIIDSRLTLGLYNIQGSYFNEAKEAIEPIVDLAVKYGDKRRLSQIYTILGTYSFVCQEDYPKAFQYLQGALKIAEELKDFVTLWVASHWMGHALAESCEFESALGYLERDLKISTLANIPWSISIMKSCIAMTVYCNQGKTDLAYQTSHDGLRLAEESGDTLSKAEAYTSCGICCYGRGYMNEAERHLMDGIAFSERIKYYGLNMLANYYLGEIYFDRREYPKSQHYFNKSIALLEQSRVWPSRINLGKILLARAKVMNNDKAINLDALYECAERNKVKLQDGLMARGIGHILMNIDDDHITEAEHWIQKAIEAHQRNRMMFNLGEDYALYADLFKRKGDRLKAQENLGKAIEIFKECGADGWVEKGEEDLSSLL
jgi:class 3 adenylate cyclase/tetratricopeptide (TPR) repeat protein